MKEKESTVNNNTIEYLELSAGMGKTFSTIKWVIEDQIPKGVRWVYIAPSKELIKETLSLIQSLGCEDVAPITDEYFKDGVMKNTVDLLKNYHHINIFLITHSNFENILHKKEEYIFEGYSVVIDELPRVFEMHDLSLSSKTDVIRDNLSPVGANKEVYTLDKAKSKIEQLQRDGKRNDSSKINCFARALSKSNVVVKEDYQEYSKYQTYSILDYTDFMIASERVILLGAKITNTLTQGILQRQDIHFKKLTDVEVSRNKYLNQERVTLYYLTDEKVKGGCTSTILTSAYNLKTGRKLNYKQYSHLPNGIDDLEEGYVNVYQEYVNRACTLLGEDFLYTVNYIPRTKTYKDVEYNGIPYGVCIPYGCHGLNKYSSYTKVLSLFCYKPSPVQKKLLTFLQEELSYPDIIDRYVDLHYKEASYQLATRCSLRDFSDVTKEIKIVVPDVEVANYIRDNHIPECNLDNSLALYIPDNREFNKGRDKDILVEKFSLGDSQRKKFNNYKTYFRKTKGREPSEDECLVKINKIIGV